MSYPNRSSDIGKSTGPQSSTSENSGGPMKNSCTEPFYGGSYVEKIILGPVKVLEDQ